MFLNFFKKIVGSKNETIYINPNGYWSSNPNAFETSVEIMITSELLRDGDFMADYACGIAHAEFPEHWVWE